MMIIPETNAIKAYHLEERALHVALLAFRCARQDDEKQDKAAAIALKAYLAIAPGDADASDKVIECIANAVQRYPHFLIPELD
ncbi:MAG: hypothetical protein ACRBM6_17740 [Geminicoccales bacterium]